MFDEVNVAIDAYQAKWQTFVSSRKNKDFFERLTPTAIGWKVADVAEYDRLLHTWRDACDQIHIARLNDRWIAALHLKDAQLHRGIGIIKLMQRRPDSSDVLGLDHFDFLDTEETSTKAILAEETEVKWSEERNGISVWTSVWFADTEAKLRPHTVLDVSIAELQIINNQVRGPKFAVHTGEGTGAVLAEVE
jgi:hypothetical protein